MNEFARNSFAASVVQRLNNLYRMNNRVPHTSVAVDSGSIHFLSCPCEVLTVLMMIGTFFLNLSKARSCNPSILYFFAKAYLNYGVDREIRRISNLDFGWSDLLLGFGFTGRERKLRVFWILEGRRKMARKCEPICPGSWTSGMHR
jgi:hypothetical protein